MPSRDGTTKLGSLFPGKKFRDLTIFEKRTWYKTYYKKTPEANKKAQLKHRAQLLNDFFDHYGHSCTCCGESHKSFLSIEHLNGGGMIHRKNLPGGRDRIIRDIKNSGWPNEYTTLCMNCNWGKAKNGGICPHIVEKARLWLEEIRMIQQEINESSK